MGKAKAIIVPGRGAWIPVSEALAVLAQIGAPRGATTLYRWIREGRVRRQDGPDGVVRVWGRDVIETVSSIRRGRATHG